MQKESPADIEQLKPDQKLDTRDMACPMPLLKAKKALENMQPGQLLELLGNDPVSKNDIPGWCTFTGHKFIAIKEEGAFFRMYIKKA